MLNRFFGSFVNKALLSLVLSCLTFSVFAEDFDYRNLHNNMSKGTDPDAQNAAPHLPKVIEEILLQSRPLDDGQTAVQKETNAPNKDDEILSNLNSHDDSLNAYSSSYTFDKLGFRDGVKMAAGQDESNIGFTLPIDKMVSSARLEIYVQQTEAMAERHPHLKVKLNEQELGTIPLTSKELTSYELTVPTEYLSEDNSLVFQVVDDKEFSCLIDYSDKYLITVDPKSHLDIDGYILSLDPNLSVFPLPFLDSYENDKTTVNFVLPELLTPEIVHGAAMLASYFGIKAEYRGVGFNTSLDTLPVGNSIIFGHPKQTVAGIELPDKAGVYMKDNPFYKPYKNVYVVASSDEDFVNAILTLTESEKNVETNFLPIKAYPKEIHQPYDAPYWISANRKVYLHELLRKDQSLLTRGFFHAPLDIAFRSAPDLYQIYGSPSDLFISYEFPPDYLDEEASGLDVSISGNYLDKLPVNKKGLLENLWRLCGGNGRENERHIPLQPTYVYGDNELRFFFDTRLKRGTACDVMRDTNIKSVIDEKSYIDLSNSVHFARMPNLAFFVGASFPFTRYADFSHTAVLLPDHASVSELDTLFNLMARSGNATGTMVSADKVYLGSQILNENQVAFKGLDLLAVATLKHREYLQKLLEGSSFELNSGDLNIVEYGMFSLKGGLMSSLERFLTGDFRSENADANRYVRTNSAWRGFLSLISPFDRENVAVVVTATSDDELSRLGDDLDNREINKSVTGDLSVISGQDKVMSYSVGDYIYQGEVSTAFKVLFFAGKHAVWFCVVGFFVLVMFSIVASRCLRKRAQKRLMVAAGK